MVTVENHPKRTLLSKKICYCPPPLPPLINYSLITLFWRCENYLDVSIHTGITCTLLQTLDGYIAKPFSPCKLFRNVLHVCAHT